MPLSAAVLLTSVFSAVKFPDTPLGGGGVFWFSSRVHIHHSEGTGKLGSQQLRGLVSWHPVRKQVANSLNPLSDFYWISDPNCEMVPSICQMGLSHLSYRNLDNPLFKQVQACFHGDSKSQQVENQD